MHKPTMALLESGPQLACWVTYDRSIPTSRRHPRRLNRTHCRGYMSVTYRGDFLGLQI